MENILWGFALLFLLLFGTMVGLIMRYHSLFRRYVKLEEWAEDWLKRLEVKTKDADLKADRVMDRVTETRAKTEALADRVTWVESAYEELETMLPKNSRGEVVRNEILLQQLNDEMERGLKMEKEWNDGLSSILNYGKPKSTTEVN